MGTLVNFSAQQSFGFDPRTIPGCTLWLDAADTNAMTFSSGSNVSTWKDKSQSGLTGTAEGSPVLTANSIGSMPGIAFNGSTQYINFGNNLNLGTNSLYMFVVFKYDSTANGGIVGKTSARGLAGRWALLRESGNTFFLLETNIGVNLTYADSSVTPQLVTAFWDRSNAFILQNGTQRNTAASGNTSSWTTSDLLLVGAYPNNTGGVPPQAGLYFNGKIGEILVYQPPSPLTTVERQAVEGYLASKWKYIQSNRLPLTHPFSSISPIMRPFLPTDIANCSLWFDAADSSTITISSGTTVTKWNDKSSNANHTTAVNGTVSYLSNAVNSRPAMSFSNTFFTGPVSPTFTGTTMHCFIVGTINSATTQYGRMVSLGVPGVNDAGNVAYCTPFIRNNNTANLYAVRGGVGSPNFSITYDVPFIAQTAFNNSTMAQGINGTSTMNSTSSTGSFNITGYTLAQEMDTSDAGGKHYGYICEFIAYFGTVLTNVQRQQVEGYLAAKWGLSSLFPTTQPFYLLRSVPSTPVFNPNQISALSLWLDAGDPSTLTLSGSTVTGWADKSGNGRNANFDTNKPTYDSSNRYVETSNNNVSIRLPAAAFTNTGNQTCSLFIVYADKQQGTNNQGLFSTSDYGLYQLLRCPTYPAPYGIRGNMNRGDSNYIAFMNRLMTTNTLIYSMQYTAGVTGSSNYIVAPNGFHWNPIAGNTQSVSGELYLGGITNFDTAGDIRSNLKIYEVVVFNNIILTSAQRQQVEGYLAWKWGTQASLPSTHPFKKFKP